MKSFIFWRNPGITQRIKHGLGVGEIGPLVFAVSRTAVPIGLRSVALNPVPLGFFQPRHAILHPRIFRAFNDRQS
ncbi:MAG: hypothetical protein CBD11_07200 [Phycisphaera sp. TMED151]|nr:MAG: hypothetical protein CBD11_07200 [Phycisphaera sp. TMED151]